MKPNTKYEPLLSLLMIIAKLKIARDPVAARAHYARNVMRFYSHHHKSRYQNN